MPHPKSFDVVREWLSKQSKQTSVVVAARSALRAVPLLGPLSGNTFKASFNENWELLALHLFRANFVVWACGQIPAQSLDLSSLVKDARTNLLTTLSTVPSSIGDAALAVSDAAVSASATESEVAIAAIHALQTVVAGSYASKSRVAALIADYQALLKGKSLIELSRSPLWYSTQSSALADGWKNLEVRLLGLEHDWDVWISWYVDRIFGRPIDVALLMAWLNVPVDLWEAGPQAVNAYLKQIAANPELSAVGSKLGEPELEPGPEFDIGPHGLSLKVAHSPQGSFDERSQRSLHERLQRIAPILADTSRKAANAHPGLEAVATEYEELVTLPFDQIDVVALWAVGTGLLANRDAFARAHHGEMMAEPLEPAHFALLQQVSEIHGGFILGFPQARDLAERADNARLSGEAMDRVVTLARSIIGDLRNSGRQIEGRTRRFLAAVEEGLVEPGWKITRAGYAAYVVTRNALIAIGRLLNWANSAFATVGGGLILSSVDPGLVQTQFWVEFVLKNSQQILAFSEPFPELKIWLSAQIDAAQRDNKARKAVGRG